MNASLRQSTIALIGSSLLLTIGRGATLPFMTIYLNRRFGMDVETIGYALTLALTAGILFSLAFGIVADKFDKKRYMLAAVAAFIGGFVAIPLVNGVAAVVFFFSLINCAYSVFSTVLKAFFSDSLADGEKSRIFSLNYSVINIGWTVGPPIGTWLVMYGLELPFWLAAACAALPLVFIQLYVPRAAAAAESVTNAAAWRPSVLLKDRALLWYTLSGVLASYVGGSFATCISQYVLVEVDSADFAQKVVAVVLPVNAVMVVSLQYFIGRAITPRNIGRLMTVGMLFFVIGLLMFITAHQSLWLWGAAAALFTVGEIIYAPGEYMLIDSIAPPGMKASYFSAQMLGWLGAAANPMITGAILTSLPAWTVFGFMIAAIVIAWLMVQRGMRIARLRAA